MDIIRKLHEWKQTRFGHIVTGVIEAGLAYLFASLAIDTGSWGHYLLTFIFLGGAIMNLVKTINNGKE